MLPEPMRIKAHRRPCLGVLNTHEVPLGRQATFMRLCGTPSARDPTIFQGGRDMMDPVLFDNLRSLFNPTSVAVIGASANPDKLGFHVMKSLVSGNFGGTIIPVNPGSEKIMGIRALPSIDAFAGTIELAVVVLPADRVPGIFKQAIRKGVKGMVLITAGFKEIEDPRGGELQDLLARLALEARMPVIGPNTFGIINLHRRLNASFTPQFSQLPKGHISLVSQSGGMSHLLAFAAMRQHIGFSKIIGLGNRLTVDFAEMVAYLMEDPETRVIILYLEGLDDPRRLIGVARKYRGKKPIIAYKTGRASSGDRASLSHTGSLAGKQEIYEGALKQAGILCLQETELFLDAAHALAKSPVLKGKRVAILSGQAGPGMAACDICEAEGLEISAFRPRTQQMINERLPPLALRTNPVDLGPAWYNASVLSGIVRAVMEDENVDGLLLLMMYASANEGVVPGLSGLLREWKQKKPVVTCFLSPTGIWDDWIFELESEGTLVNFPTPERAAKAMAALLRCKETMGEASALQTS